MTDQWQPVSVDLVYRLGEIPLFVRRLRGLACREHFSRLPAFTRLPDAHLDAPADTAFFFYPTYPIAFEPRRLVRAGDWIAYTPYTFKNYYIDLGRLNTFDQYLAQFSSKSRSTLLRKVRKFTEASGGELHWRQFDDAPSMAEFFALAGPLSSKTYQERLLNAGLPQNEEFVRNTCELAGEGGSIGYVLFLRGAPAAYMLCFCRRSILTYDFVGYDPEFKALSPGTVLQFVALRALFGAGKHSAFDFTEGESEHKSFFATDHRACAKTYFLRSTAVNSLLLRSHAVLHDVTAGLGRTLDAVGAKSAVRKLVRRLA